VSQRVCIGVIAGAHGTAGAVRVKSFTADPEDVGAYGPVSDEAEERSFTLSVIGRAKGIVVARIEGIGDRGAADALKGMLLYVPRAALPETETDEYYHADLVGLAVELTDGKRLGQVRAMSDFGAGDVMEVEMENGETVILPFNRAAVPEVDLAGGRLVVDPPAGLLDLAPEKRRPRKKRAGGRKED
jgi:16S rRNA processing protein RimM